MALSSKELLQAEISKRSFHEFVKFAWPLVDPEPFVDNWHIGLLSEYLQATVWEGSHKPPEIKRLAINLPPRLGKSKLFSVLYPAWNWAHSKETKTKFLYFSYSEDLALQDAETSRNLIQSEWYKKCFPHVVLSKTQSEKSYFATIKGGYRISTGIGGRGTGLGGDVIVADDVLKADNAFSDAMKKDVRLWWKNTITSRLNSQKTGVKIVVGQRLAHDDIFQYLEDGEEYQWIILPLEYQGKKFISYPKFKEDPRTKEGELLWPERIGPNEVAAIKGNMSTYEYNAQFNQTPSSETTAIFKKDWFINRINDDHSIFSTFISWDLAAEFSDKNDFSAVTVGQLTTDYRLIIKEIQEYKLDFIALTKMIEDYNNKYAYKFSACLIEAKANGNAAIQTLRKTSEKYRDNIIAINSKDSKEARAHQAALWCEKGCVYLPTLSESRPWLPEFEDELLKFPVVKHDDRTDSFTQLVIYLQSRLERGYRDRLKNNQRRVI